MTNNKNRLYVIFRDHHNEIIFESFIHHIDAVRSHTVIDLKPKACESDIIRLPQQMKSVQCIDGKVIIHYFFDYTLEIERRNA